MGKGERGYRRYDVEGFEVLVGRGDADNDELSLRVADPHDFWLHVAATPGSHVVVRNPQRLDELPVAVVERAAQLAVWFSKSRQAGGKVAVHMCRAADVGKKRGMARGAVLLRRYSTVRVYARPPEEDPPGVA
jgi:predicted ribosome quality control (RQC) complex YloA/Tae2 family protein